MFNINSFYLSFPILKLHYWGFLYKNIFKKIQKIFHIVSYNSLVRSSFWYAETELPVVF